MRNGCMVWQRPFHSHNFMPLQGGFNNNNNNVMLMNHNPMFSANDKAQESPWLTSVCIPAEEQGVLVEARVTFPDAGNLFAPMHEVLAASAPEHISHKFQNPAHYDSTLRSLAGVYVESDTA
jgi:hypothetical protein